MRAIFILRFITSMFFQLVDFVSLILHATFVFIILFMTWIFLGLAVIGNTAANVLMKLGAKQMGGFSFSFSGLKLFFSTPLIWAGMVSFALTLLCYTYVLSKLNLSVAYPIITSLGFLLVTVFSTLYFHESIHWLQIVGMFVIVFGLYLVVYTAK